MCMLTGCRSDSPAGTLYDNVCCFEAQLLHYVVSHLLTSRAPGIIAAAALVEDKDVSVPNVLAGRQLGMHSAGIWHDDEIVCNVLLPIRHLRPAHL